MNYTNMSRDKEVKITFGWEIRSAVEKRRKKELGLCDVNSTIFPWFTKILECLWKLIEGNHQSKRTTRHTHKNELCIGYLQREHEF